MTDYNKYVKQLVFDKCNFLMGFEIFSNFVELISFDRQIEVSNIYM